MHTHTVCRLATNVYYFTPRLLRFIIYTSYYDWKRIETIMYVNRHNERFDSEEYCKNNHREVKNSFRYDLFRVDRVYTASIQL